MNKRIISIALAIFMCLSLFIPVSASSAPTLSARYRSGTVTVTGNGFSSGYSYTARIVNTSNTSIIAMKQIAADSNGRISASITTGALSSSNHYAVYVNIADGTVIASAPSVSFSSGGGGNHGGDNDDEDEDDGDNDDGTSTTIDISKFKDISSSGWYYEAVKFIIEAGLMKGTSSTTFEPNSSMTRAMFVTVLYRLADEPAVSGSSRFIDVSAGSWYEDAVLWGNKNGIVNGINDKKFDPDTPVTREQMAAFMHRYANFAGQNFADVSGSKSISSYRDNGSVSGWAVEALSWSLEKGLILGTGNDTLSPRETATRAQVATILMRYIKNSK